MDSLEVFSAYTNIKEFFEKGKDVSFSRIVFRGRLDRQREMVRGIVLRVCQDINNHRYSIEDFKVYVMYHYFFKKSFFWKEINFKEVPQIATLFTKNNLYLEKKFVLSTSEKAEIKDMETLYKINSNGNNILMDFIEKGFISPAFYVKYFPTEFPESKHSVNKTTEQINKTTIKIKKNKGVKKWVSEKEKN